MTRRPSPRLTAYSGIAATGLLAGLALGRPELVALAAPFALVLVAGLLSPPTANLDLRVRIDAAEQGGPVATVLEGDQVRAVVTVRAERAVDRVDVVVELPDGLAVADGPRALAVRLAAGEEREVALPLRCERWGLHRVGPVHARAYGRLRLFADEHQAGERLPLKVLPRLERLRTLVRPATTLAFVGEQRSRQRGDGVELAEVRPFLPGDRARSINWRATARRGRPFVSDRHPERNTDVVLFLDSFIDVRDEGTGTLDLAVRAAASLASAYLARRDRVGLVGFGGYVTWLQPGTGPSALYRLLDALLETQVFANASWKGINQIPVRVLPAKALVVALTPLLDPRAVTALVNLYARGYDLVVVDVSPLPLAASPRGEWGSLARRLWSLEREALRHRLQRLGVAAVEWTPGTELEALLVEVEACRRFARSAAGG